MKKILLLTLLCLLLSACGKKEDAPVVLDFTNETVADVDPQGLKPILGEIMSIKQNGSTVVVKMKITESWNNKMTVNQNYDIVQDLIQKHGFNTCQELQYWAVMDVGMEIKVISFTLDKATIDGIYADKLFGEQIEPFTKDLWIAPALTKNTD